ncbi:putative disease resistance protein RGA3 [Pistacia vera]|uniref:putative disease resistance protein RGA3 n=1 Tax=Pistacia vera TaxID=55513 RepID=UPI0012634AD9|nr:putative disease resistance protein RGA3 [Pistacia vera]
MLPKSKNQETYSHCFQNLQLKLNKLTSLEPFQAEPEEYGDNLLNAEEKQAQNCVLQEDLEWLSDQLYDAKDVVDEVECELEKPSNKELKNKREVWSDNLREMMINHTCVGASEVFGRDGDMEKIINFLKQPKNEGEKVSVITIVGGGGIGKTTLAKLMYSDKTVDELFDLKMWVSVPEDFDIITLMKETCTSATGQNQAGLAVNELEDRLLDELDGKKFLLVLDDVWNENYDKWDKFKNLLTQKPNGSKIVVTTRINQVAKVMGAVDMSVLEGLSQKDSMLLFKKWAAFTNENNQIKTSLKLGLKLWENVMHDFVHDLVLKVAQTDCEVVDLRFQGRKRNARHLSFLDIKYSGQEVPSISKKLRTIIMQSVLSEHVTTAFLNTWILRLSCFSGLQFEALPDSIGELKHLRCLYLSWNLSLQEIPELISKLPNLQTLILLGCSNLQKLPRNMQKMTSIRYLEITIKEIGEWMQSFTGLRKLGLEGCDSSNSLPYNIKDLKGLKKLVIRSCPKINLKMDLKGEDPNLSKMDLQSGDSNYWTDTLTL